MKVKSRNLINGLLLFGLPVASMASVESVSNTRDESFASTKVVISTSATVEDFDLSMLDGVIHTQPAMEEALRERLRAWTDEAELVYRQRFAGYTASFVVLARN